MREKLTNIQRIKDAIEDGCQSIKEIKYITGMSQGTVSTTVHRMILVGYEFPFKQRETAGVYGSKKQEIVNLKKYFYGICGFNPTGGWLAAKSGVTRQRVHQIMLGAINSLRNDIVVRHPTSIYVPEDVDKEVCSIALKLEITYREAFNAWLNIYHGKPEAIK